MSNRPAFNFIPVQDADTEKDFRKNARLKWRELHQRESFVGRPSVKHRVFTAIPRVQNDLTGGKRQTQGRLIQLLQARLPELSRDVIRKYVKMYRLYKRSLLTPQEFNWLCKRDTVQAKKGIAALQALEDRFPGILSAKFVWSNGKLIAKIHPKTRSRSLPRRG